MEYHYEYKGIILDVSEVSFSYPDQNVLSKINFTIKNVVRPNTNKPQGQIVALLGKSGVGKSTLLKIIAGQLEPNTGSVSMLVHESDKELQPANEGNVGIVYQDYLFFEHLTVKNLMRLGAKQGGIPKEKIEEEVTKVLQAFELEGQENKWRQELSGGQRQRVAIAQQLLLGRQILILDEPFSGLDYSAKTKVAHFIQKVASLNEYKTILLITHDIESAVMISDTVYILSQNVDGSGASVGSTYNLMEEGIAWRKDNHLSENFRNVVQKIKDTFLQK